MSIHRVMFLHKFNKGGLRAGKLAFLHISNLGGNAKMCANKEEYLHSLLLTQFIPGGILAPKDT